MRLDRRDVNDKTKEGSVKVAPEESEDMWHLYNLISEDDEISSTTTRNILKETAIGTGSKTKIKFTITIKVEKIEYDSEKSTLRLSGKNVQESEYIKMGQYHTVSLELNQAIVIRKSCWDSIFIERLNEACNPASKAEIAAIVMQEGLAHICLLTQAMTITKLRIERNIPKKSQMNQNHNKSIIRFFEDIYEGIKKSINFDMIKVVLIGSPGFLKDDFMEFFNKTAVERGDTLLLQNKSKFLKVHASSGHKNAIEQILVNPDVRNQLNDVKAVNEVKALERFYQVLSTDENRAVYGFRDVFHADTLLSIDELLVTDKLFKAANPATRSQYVSLVESVKSHGGKIFIFSSMHVSGEQLDQYTGIAATLRFPIASLPNEDEDSDEEVDVNAITNNSTNYSSFSEEVSSAAYKSNGLDEYSEFIDL